MAWIDDGDDDDDDDDESDNDDVDDEDDEDDDVVVVDDDDDDDRWVLQVYDVKPDATSISDEFIALYRCSTYRSSGRVTGSLTSASGLRPSGRHAVAIQAAFQLSLS